MPFLRLTRDRREFENTFLLHADRPGGRPRLLYWYRTAPGILLGRAALDEEAIRTIEEQHPEIDFDWPAILALGEVMMHQEQASDRPERRGRPPRSRDREPSGPPRSAARVVEAEAVSEPKAESEPMSIEGLEQNEETEAAVQESSPPRPTMHGLLEELVGREIATRLRARHAEMCARIRERHTDPSIRDAWLQRIEAIDPELWLTPAAILEGVRQADAVFDGLRRALLDS